MRPNLISLFALASLALGALPALAGESGDSKKRCPMETSACIREMAKVAERRAWIGIEFESPSELTITRVVAGSPAERAGVRVGDVWLGLDDFRFAGLREKESMQRVKKTLQPGAKVQFHLRRGAREMALEIEPVRVPRHILAQWVGHHVLEGHLEPADEVADGDGAAQPGDGGEGE